MKTILSLAVTAAAGLALIGCSSTPTTEKKAESSSTTPATPAPAAETPAPKKTQAPEVYKVNFDTSKGAIVLEIHRDWAPIGSDHFYELVQAKYFDGDRFFRVLKGFVVQFGLNGDPGVTAHWQNMTLPDDPVTKHNTPGTIVYATAGPATRTTQLFINLGDNTRNLDSQGFAPFGKVLTGMDVVEEIYGGYGETPEQGLITSRGNDYLTQHFPKLDYIKTATIAQ